MPEETVRTGIDGLDELLGGGFEKGDLIAIEGDAG
jgi:KaiC/GvpD/RAD55 family RecA-like ATPase